MNSGSPKITQFQIDGQNLPVQYIETQTVKDGVVCDIYTFTSDTRRDLAIVTVQQGSKTPLQRILTGTRTIEGYVSGKGTLSVQDGRGKTSIYRFPNNESNDGVEVSVGQLMQWEADQNDHLVFSEICDPPYVDGRFENLPE